jgi:hypothetical protein
MVDEWITYNFETVQVISKKVLGARFGEGISEYYIYLTKRGSVPEYVEKHIYYFMMNLKRSNSAINYKSLTFQNSIPENFDVPDSGDELKKWDYLIDLGDEELVDFLVNNHNNDKWIKIWEVFYRNKVKFNLFEKIMFDYVFIKGFSIRKIQQITGNSQDFVYKMRKSLIQKIKEEI